jgi:hypothetical protein
MDGFESGGDDCWDFVGLDLSPYISGTYKYSGNYGLYLGAASNRYCGIYQPDRTEYYTAFKLYAVGQSDSVLYFMEGATIHGGLACSASGAGFNFKVTRGHSTQTNLEIGSTLYNLNTWYLVECYFKLADSGGRWTVKVNGIQEIDFTGDTRNGGASGVIDTLRVGYPGGGWYPNFRIDDIVFDTTDWIGDTRIGGTLIDGAGNSADWTPSAGSNYQTVDEVPESDADYNYINTVDQIDTFSVGDVPAEAYAIKCVQVMARAQKEGASTPQNIAVGVRPPVGGTDYFSSDQALATVWKGHVNLWENNPYTAAAWTPTEVNSTEIGYKSRT